MNETAELFVDLQRGDGSTVGIFTIEDFAALPDDVTADTVAQLFTRCRCGSRNDLGTRAQVSRAISVTASAFSVSKVSGR